MNNDSLIQRILNNFTPSTQGSIDDIRRQVLQTVSWIIVVAGLTLLGLSLEGFLSGGITLFFVVSVVSFVYLLVQTILAERIPYNIRAASVILIALIQGLFNMNGLGLAGDGRTWLMFSNLLSTILLGLNIGLLVNAISISSLIFYSYLAVSGIRTMGSNGVDAFNANIDNWISIAPTFVLVTLILTIITGLIIRGMEQGREELGKSYTETQTLTEQLATEQEQLQKQTTLLEKRTRYIEAAAEVGKTATSIYNIDEMLDQVVDMISERFGFYQAGIFLIDDRNEYADMVAASSDGGKRMLARGHKLRVSEEGMVGYVTSQGQARIALDVGDEATHFNTPELPLTRSEMTLPLFYGGRIFGALDVQSTMEHAFAEEDISALTVLADQVSMAINNARLFEELQTSLESERQAFGEVSRQAWHNLIRRTGSWGYRFSNNRTSVTEKLWPEEMAQALENQQVVNTFAKNGALSVPIIVSNAPVGVIRVQKPTTGVDWTDDEKEIIQTLTDRLSQALESARVYQASQNLALQEQLTTEISGQLRRTLDIDTVLKTAAKELGDAFNAKEVVIRMAPDESRN